MNVDRPYYHGNRYCAIFGHSDNKCLFLLDRARDPTCCFADGAVTMAKVPLRCFSSCPATSMILQVCPEQHDWEIFETFVLSVDTQLRVVDVSLSSLICSMYIVSITINIGQAAGLRYDLQQEKSLAVSV